MRDIGYKAYISDIFKGIATRLGLDISRRWYDIYSGESEESGESEKEKALKNFLSDFEGGENA